MKEVYLADLSLLTPLGADPESVHAAINAGINSYQQCDILGEGEPSIQFAPVPSAALKVPVPAQLPGLSPPQIRLLKLAAFALADIAPRLPASPIPLFLAGPEPYYYPGIISAPLIKHLINSTGVNVDTRTSRYFSTGRSGTIAAIDIAFRYFEATGAPYALVGGVDTFYDIRTLSVLDKQQRLSGGSFDGFVPGEAAAFLLLASPHAPKAAIDNSLLRLHQPTIVHEPGHLLGGAPYTAEALATAITAVMTGTEPLVDTIYSSENGEMHYNKELTVAMLRNRHRLNNNYEIVRPAEHLGDTGAAFGSLAIALATNTVSTTSTALVCASSDGGPRGAICLTAP